MKQRLYTTSVVVPADNEGRNFRYFHTESSHWSESSIYGDLLEKYLEHRRSNGFPIPQDYEAVIQDQMCSQLPPEWCERAKGQSWVSTRFTFDDFKNGMKAFARLFLGGFNFVEESEANRRAKICANCYYNVNLPGGCGTCLKMSDYVTGEVAQRTTAYDGLLKACAVCHCSNKAQAWFRMEDLASTDTPEKQALYPDSFCWKSKDSPNFREAIAA